MTGLLFVTAPEATHKDINFSLLYLRDWAYSGPEGQDWFKLVTTKNAYDLERPAGESDRDLKPTSPPVARDIDNSWAGAPLGDVEAYCIDLARPDEINPPYNAHLYLVIDSQGFEDKTCILGERFLEWEEGKEIAYPEKFKKFRLSWDEAYITWCNLDIANMGFEDFGDEIEGDEDGWHEYYNAGGSDLSAEAEKRKADEIEKLRQDGSI